LQLVPLIIVSRACRMRRCDCLPACEGHATHATSAVEEARGSSLWESDSHIEAISAMKLQNRYVSGWRAWGGEAAQGYLGTKPGEGGCCGKVVCFIGKRTSNHEPKGRPAETTAGTRHRATGAALGDRGS